MTEVIAYIGEWRSKVPVDRSEATGRCRPSAPHLYEPGAIARRYC